MSQKVTGKPGPSHTELEVPRPRERWKVNLGSTLNVVVVFNLEVTHAARFALKTTTAFNEEPKKENSARKAKENTKIIAKNSRF